MTGAVVVAAGLNRRTMPLPARGAAGDRSTAEAA